MTNLTDNLAHRALFTVPPIRRSAETAPAVQVLPEQKVVTGHVGSVIVGLHDPDGIEIRLYQPAEGDS